MPKQTDDTRLVTILLIIIGAFVIFPMFFMGFGMMGYGSMMGGMWSGGMWGGGTMSGWMFIVGIVMQALFLAFIVGGGYLIYRTVMSDSSDADQALEELRLAYARGELTDEEYEQRREALEGDT
ncbi:SHOCT domain-containing protein [Halosimplex sp. TS25]|uniref:SHOCT domain-containing protein n=1 Tax=Halosimplex rarum TaxID=3396619 RepID=UPI0039EB0F0C